MLLSYSLFCILRMAYFTSFSAFIVLLNISIKRSYNGNAALNIASFVTAFHMLFQSINMDRLDTSYLR